MLDLLKDFALTALIIIMGHWIYGISETSAYDSLVLFITANKTRIFTIGFLVSAGTVLFAALFQGLGLSQATFMVSKFFARLCQFFISFISILSIVFYAAMGLNFLRDNGYFLLVIMVLTLGATCWALRMIDFNHHTQNVLLPTCLLAFISVLLVEFIWPFFGF